jgi:hypothetical protein
MPTTPAITATVKITAKDINGNNIAKQFDSVSFLFFDYNKGMVQVTDVTGQFYFSLTAITTLTYVIVSGVGGVTTVVMS